MTIGLNGPLQGLAPGFITGPISRSAEGYLGLWQGCLTQLPDTTFGLAGWKADQCTEVPTIANGGESVDYKATMFHIDPRAVWSDGMPITADDFVFAFLLAADPKVGGGIPVPGRATAVDVHTVRIDWASPFGDYLYLITHMPPLPLHIYAKGPFVGVYNPKTGAYDSALAQQLVAGSLYYAMIPADNGPFTVQSFDPGSRAILIRNPRFFSNFYHAPALDSVTLVSDNPQWPHGPPEAQLVDALSGQVRQGGVQLVDGLSVFDLSQLGAIPKDQVLTSPSPNWIELAFNQRGAAPNATANGGASIFRDPTVRKAFVEALDRCAAVRAQLAVTANCADPNLFTDEFTVPPAPDYDPTLKLPGYNPSDAARLMDRAGYPVVDGIRRAKDGTTPLHITIDLSPGATRLAPVIGQRMQQDYARNLQVAVTVASPPDFLGGAFSEANTLQRGDFDITLWGEDGDLDPQLNAQLVSILSVTDAAHIPSALNPTGPNALGIVDPVIVQQEQLGEQIQDPAQRANVYRALQRHTVQQFYAEPVFILADVVLATPTLCNYKKSAVFPGNLWNIADWYIAPSCP